MAVLKDRKSLTALLDGVLKLSWTPKTGLFLSPTSSLVNYIAHEPMQGEHRHFSQVYTAEGVYALPPSEKPTTVFHSPSRGKKVVVREKEEKTQVVLEVWEQNRMCMVKDLKTTHQNFVTSAVFGSLVWNSTENLVAYIAERKEIKPASFFTAEETAERVGEQFLYKENFGERHEDISNPGLFLLDISTSEVHEVDIPQDIYPAQPCFHPNTPELVFIGYDKEPYLRGIAAMTNRSSHLYLYSLENRQTHPIDTSFPSNLYPVFNPTGSKLAYFALHSSLAHTSCALLRLIDWETKQNSTLIDQISHSSDSFSGIYGYHETLIKLNWISDLELIFQSVNKCNSGVFMSDLSGNVTEVEFDMEKPWSAEIFDVWRGKVMLKCSNVKQFARVYEWKEREMRVLDAHGVPERRSGYQEQALAALQSLQIKRITHKNSGCESVLYWKQQTQPLAVLVHGGPHGNNTADYSVEATMLATLGLNLLVVNYRGSTGLGQDQLQTLLGHIGQMDLEDVLDAIEVARETVSTEKVVSIGGSHGGFLSAHLAATGKVQAAVVKNGVMNIASMNYVTDITDWPSAETLNAPTAYPTSPEDITRMYTASPISRAHQITIPVLIITGGSDKRVPSFQSIELYRVLKSLHQDVTLFLYPKDGHGLMTPSTGYDFLLNELQWLVSKLGLV